MTAIDHALEHGAMRNDQEMGRSSATEHLLFATLMSSVGRPDAPASAAEIGRLGASAAPGKRKKGHQNQAAVNPTMLAVAELGSRGATKATVQAARGDLTNPEPQTGQRPTAARGLKQPGIPSEAFNRAHTDLKPAPGGVADAANRPGARKESAVSHSVSDPGRPANRMTPPVLPGAAAPRAAVAAQSRFLRSDRIFSLERAQPAQGRSNVRPISAPHSASKPDTGMKHKHGAPPALRDPEADFAAQLGRGFAAILRQSGGTLTLRLQPEALGELTIRMDLQPGQVAAEFEVQSDQAQQLLHKHMSALRSALEARGLGVDSLTVQVSQRPEQDAPAQFPAEPGTYSGGADDSGGGAPDRRENAGKEAPLAGQARSVEQAWPEAGAVGVETGGAHVVRLALDAIA